MKSKQMTFTLTEGMEELIKALAAKLHMPKAQVLRYALSRLAEVENIKPEAARPQG